MSDWWNEPGVFTGVPESRYRADPAIAYSDLKGWIKPVRQSRAMIIGSALHHAVLEPDIFRSVYTVMDEEVKLNTKVGKAAMAEFEERHPGQTILKPSEMDEVKALYRALKECEPAMRIIDASGDNELSVVGNLQPDVLSKCRVDGVRKSCRFDIKTTGRTMAQFEASIRAFGYDGQMAYYRDLTKTVMGEDLPFLFIVCSKADHTAWVQPIKDADLWAGRRWYEDILTLYARHQMVAK